MLISRLVAVLFVVTVGLFVGLATAFRDPADSAPRLPAELEVQNIELATEPFDALAEAFDPFDVEQAQAATHDVLSDQLTALVLSDLETGLSETALSTLIRTAVEARLTPSSVEALNDILIFGVPTVEGADQVDPEAERDAEPVTPTTVLALSDEEQRRINFGDAVGEHAVALFLSLQAERGPLAKALEQVGLKPLDQAVRPRLTRIPRIAYRTLEAEMFTPSEVVSGASEVTRRADIRARTGSTIAEIFVDRGDRVDADQVLLILDEDGRDAQRLQAVAGIAQAEANVLAAEAAVVSAAAQVTQAEINLSDAQEAQADVLDLGDFASDTQRRNAASQVTQAQQSLAVAQSGVEQAEASTAQAEASLESAKASLVQIDLDIERLQVTAPFTGRIETRHVELGGLVNPGEALFTLTDFETMVIAARVSDRVRQTLSLGDVAKVVIGEGATAVETEGPITLIDTTSNAGTRTFEIEIEIPNRFGADGQPQIVDNQFAEVTFYDQPRLLYRIPRSALTSASLGESDDGETGLLILDEQERIQFTPVSFADYTQAGDLLIAAERLGDGPLRLVVGRGGFANIGDQVSAREVPSPDLSITMVEETAQ